MEGRGGPQKRTPMQRAGVDQTTGTDDDEERRRAEDSSSQTSSQTASDNDENDDYDDAGTSDKRPRRNSPPQQAPALPSAIGDDGERLNQELATARIQDEPPLRPRGGYRAQSELNTIPANAAATRATNLNDCRQIDVTANFVRVEPMKERHMYQYRIEFEPNVESMSLRRSLFREGTKEVFAKRPGFDGMHDVYCSQKLDNKQTIVQVANPLEPGMMVKMTIDCVATADWGSLEMLRIYNLHAKSFLKNMGFYQITSTGSWVHAALATPIGNGETLAMVRGYRTAAHIYDEGVLINLEAVHKLMQRRNVLQIMSDIRRQQPGNFKEALRSELTGKLVVTNYNKRVYRIEDVNFDVKPTSTFKDKRDDRDISYVEYFKTRHNETIKELGQPMLLVVPNNKRKGVRGEEKAGEVEREILLVPELCNIAGLTEQQRNDNRLKMDLIRASQINPTERMNQIRTFLKKFHENFDILESLKSWGYSYDTDAISIKAHVLPQQPVGFGPAAEKPPSNWMKVNRDTADFTVNSLAVPPNMPKLAIMITRIDMQAKGEILTKLRQGFEKVNLVAGGVRVFDIPEGDSPQHYINSLRKLDPDITATIVIMHNQNKEKYDAIKKVASVERGLVTQVVTAKLMTDQRKASSASLKIAIQIAAKVGGEPWRVDLPLKNAMVCGYDTYNDTAKRGRSYGAFCASLNDRYSRWYSKCDAHDRLDEMSAQIAANVLDALKKWREMNNRLPDRVIIYRDGVSEGQIGHVFEVELKRVREALKSFDDNIKLTINLVNKRCGARFYMRQGNAFANLPPGSVVDHSVTRRERFDFYLVSQSTRNGTVAPTYYNIIHDESGFPPEVHQKMAYKFCLLYYNWTGTVRVPAACQYAHKLAQLCGEHLHAPPNAILSDRLHFL